MAHDRSFRLEKYVLGKQGCSAIGDCSPHLLEALGFNPQYHAIPMWSLIPEIPTLGSWRLKDMKFKVCLGYTEFKAGLGCMKPCPKNEI